MAEKTLRFPNFSFGSFEEEYDLLPKLPKDSWPFLTQEPVLFDVYEINNNFVTEFILPAATKPENIKLIIKDNHLTISGNINVNEANEGKNKKYYRKEISNFKRTIKIPVEILEKEVEAKYENGILKITMPMAKEEPPVEIKVEMVQN